jgi:spore coat protein U-like protein
MSMFKKGLLVAAFGLGSVMMSGNTAEAGQVNGALSITANVTAACTFDSTSAVAFGAYSPGAPGALNGAGSITVTCTSGAAVFVTLSDGAHVLPGSTATDPDRSMDAGTGTPLAYELYSDAGRTVEWGSDVTNDVLVNGTGLSQAINVYGQIPAGQNVLAGNYTDSVNAVVTF